ncbi:MAG: ABC transporter ATP-binding protein [Candidatus Diapherotrites archaeon]|nr:ABC transporter ATP-binding protein [Candidatus Diapherotrites archaeon]
MASATPVIELQKVSKAYVMGETELQVLKGINLRIMEGEMVSIMGPSGSGKTTLLDVLSALLRPTSGEVFIKGRPISKMNDAQLAQVRGKTIGFIFQAFHLIPRMSALENVMLPMFFQGIPLKEREKIAGEKLKMVGLQDRMDHKPSQLSGGQRQRVAIARALVNDPDMIVADEPTGNLDSRSGEQVLQIIQELHEEHGKTVLMVTHDPTIGKMAERRIGLLDGQVISDTHRE